MAVPKAEKEAARAVLRVLNPKSISENKEYGCYIYRRGGAYRAGDPFTSDLDYGITEPDLLAALQKLPGKVMPTAFCHTHGKDDGVHIPELFSKADVQLLRDLEFAHHLSVNGYLATPSNTLVIFDRASMRDEFPREPL